MKSTDNIERDTVVTPDANDSGLSFVAKACISINTIIVQNNVHVVSLSCGRGGGIILHLAAFTCMLLTGAFINSDVHCLQGRNLITLSRGIKPMCLEMLAPYSTFELQEGCLTHYYILCLLHYYIICIHFYLFCCLLIYVQQ